MFAVSNCLSCVTLDFRRGVEGGEGEAESSWRVPVFPCERHQRLSAPLTVDAAVLSAGSNVRSPKILNVILKRDLMMMMMIRRRQSMKCENLVTPPPHIDATSATATVTPGTTPHLHQTAILEPLNNDG